jgi:hypothetical protein
MLAELNEDRVGRRLTVSPFHRQHAHTHALFEAVDQVYLAAGVFEDDQLIRPEPVSVGHAVPEPRRPVAKTGGSRLLNHSQSPVLGLTGHACRGALTSRSKFFEPGSHPPGSSHSVAIAPPSGPETIMPLIVFPLRSRNQRGETNGELTHRPRWSWSYARSRCGAERWRRCASSNRLLLDSIHAKLALTLRRAEGLANRLVARWRAAGWWWNRPGPAGAVQGGVVRGGRRSGGGRVRHLVPRFDPPIGGFSRPVPTAVT